MKHIDKTERFFWIFCICITVLTGTVSSVWTVFLLKKIVEEVLQEGEYAPHLLAAFVLSVLAGALLEILRQKLRYLLYRKREAQLEDRLIFACGEKGSGGKEVFVLIQSTVNDLVAKQTDWALECSRIAGVSAILSIYTCSISATALLICLVVTAAAICLMWNSNRKVPDAAKVWNGKMNAVYGEMWNYLRCKEMLPFLQPKVYKRYEEKSDENQKEQILLGKYTNTARICMRIGSVGITLIAVVYFGMLTIQGKYTLSELLAITMLLPNLADTMLQIPNCISQYRKLKGMEKNVNAFLENREQEENIRGERLGEMIHSIRATGIRYSYKEGECHCRIEEFSAERGRVTGIFGESGSGKTTFLKILLGELRGSEGECRINNRRVENLDQDELWSHILYLSQDPVILPVGLRENVTLEKDGERTEEERYQEALRKADIGDLAAVKGGGELDVSVLSGGEIQKVCLARCFYTNKEVIILDEATNAMSPAAEKIILHNLISDVVRENKILIIVSHNPEVISLCHGFAEIRKGSHTEG